MRDLKITPVKDKNKDCPDINSRMTIKIMFNNGRWLVNDKKLEEMNHDEQKFMDSFFKAIKEDQLINTVLNKKARLFNVEYKEVV